MTEAEWLAATDPTPMLKFLRGKASNRKFRLFMAASCRTFLSALSEDKRTLRTIEVAEAYADGSVEKAELIQSKRMALRVLKDQPRLALAVRLVTHGLPKQQAVEFPYFCLRPWKATNYNRPTPTQRRLMVQIIHDLSGNPFRFVSAVPSWLTSTVVALATGIYEERGFDRMPILADALQDAGCDNDDILNHCRQPGEHVRGCWVVDLILGKS